MWSGRFREPLNRTFEQWQRSFTLDWRLLTACLCLSFLAASALSAQGYKTTSVSLTNIQLQKGERVIGIELHGNAAAFKTLTNLPVGWNLNIDNSPSWQSKMEGSLQVGSAALDLNALQRLRITLYVYEFGDLHFGLSGKIVVTSDYEKERTLHLDSANFSLSKKQH